MPRIIPEIRKTLGSSREQQQPILEQCCQHGLFHMSRLSTGILVSLSCFLLWYQTAGLLGSFWALPPTVISANEMENNVLFASASAFLSPSSPPLHGHKSSQKQIIQQQEDFSSTINWKQRQNRTIAFVHVGKAGGITVRKSTRLVCSANTEIDTCMNRRFPPDAVISRQVYYALHMHDLQPEAMGNVTTFLIVLRNPIDRIISAFRYSHPANCRTDVVYPRGHKPGGCNSKGKAATPGTPEYQMFNACFPFPVMEDFAQSVMAPYPPFNTSSTDDGLTINNQRQRQMTSKDIADCRKMAYRIVRGFIQGPIPHFYYNMGYYLKRVINKYPDRELFAIRTEYEWEDLKELDRQLGGPGSFNREGDTQSHGSEQYAPSPLSSEAIRKLCCPLQKEILIYEELLDRSINVNETVKVDSMETIRNQCQIAATTSWETWHAECRRQRLGEMTYLRQDEK